MWRLDRKSSDSTIRCRTICNQKQASAAATAKAVHGRITKECPWDWLHWPVGRWPKTLRHADSCSSGKEERCTTFCLGCQPIGHVPRQLRVDCVVDNPICDSCQPFAQWLLPSIESSSPVCFLLVNYVLCMPSLQIGSLNFWSLISAAQLYLKTIQERGNCNRPNDISKLFAKESNFWESHKF